jgi:hypothetical protein
MLPAAAWPSDSIFGPFWNDGFERFFGALVFSPAFSTVRDSLLSIPIIWRGKTMESLDSRLISACQTGDRAAICRLLESIPRERWDIIPNRAQCNLDSVRAQVWHAAGGSGINTYEKVTVHIIVNDEDRELCVFADTFTSSELRLPNYIPLDQRLIPLNRDPNKPAL